MCQVTVDYLETEVSCSSVVCEAKRVRKSRRPHPSAGWTPLDVWTSSSQSGSLVSSLFLTNLANVVAGRDSGGGGSNALAGYIADPTSPFAANSYITDMPDLRNVSHNLITSRFTQFMNSYWTASVGHQLIIGTDETYDDAVNLTYNFSTPSEGDRTIITAEATAQQTAIEDKLLCNLDCLSALTFVILVALASSVASLVFVLLYTGPILTMDITTLLRDNKYGNMPQVGSYLDDDESARLLNDVTVRIGDVKPYDHIGHVAVVAVDAGGYFVWADY